VIGYETGASGGFGTSTRDLAPSLRDRLDDAFDLVDRVVERAIWVLERVAVISPVMHERWETGADERVCPECGPLHGMTWPEGEGPVPPLHVNCRCQRVHAFVEWRTRDVDEWHLRREWSVSGRR